MYDVYSIYKFTRKSFRVKNVFLDEQEQFRVYKYRVISYSTCFILFVFFCFAVLIILMLVVIGQEQYSGIHILYLKLLVTLICIMFLLL
jgi:hypothetical protein